MNVSAFLRKNEVWGGVEDGGAEDDKEGEEEKEEEEEEEEEDDDDASSRFDSADGVEVASIAMTAVTMIIIETKRAVISFRFSF
jgi:CO dehydrogenase/acetyl-CoA synthase beta subunit